MYISRILDKYTILMGSEIKEKLLSTEERKKIPKLDLDKDFIKIRDDLYFIIPDINRIEDNKRYIISKEDISRTLEISNDNEVTYIEDLDIEFNYNYDKDAYYIAYKLPDKYLKIFQSKYIYINNCIITELSDIGFSNYIINLEALREADLLGLTTDQKRMISLLPTSNFTKWYV